MKILAVNSIMLKTQKNQNLNRNNSNTSFGMMSPPGRNLGESKAIADNFWKEVGKLIKKIKKTLK